MIRLQGVDKESAINVPSKTIGTYHLADNPNLYEVQRSNTFEVVVPFRNLVNPVTGEVFDNAQSILNLSVSSSTVPHFTQEPITVRRGNSVMKFAGAPTFDSGTINVVDYIGANTKELVMAWQALSYNVKNERMGLASDYKQLGYLVEYTPDYQKVRQWILHGLWISGISESEYNSDSTDKRQMTLTMQYDWAEIDGRTQQ